MFFMPVWTFAELVRACGASDRRAERGSMTGQGERGGARRLVRSAPALSGALLLAALALVDRSRRAEASEHEREEREWAARELDKWRDRLAGVIESARDALRAASEPGEPSGTQPVFDVSDVDVLLEAADEVAQIQKSDPLVTSALACCVEGIALELARSTAQLRRGRQIRTGSSVAAAALVRQLEQSKIVLLGGMYSSDFAQYADKFNRLFTKKTVIFSEGEE
jgi:hypothetical protein